MSDSEHLSGEAQGRGDPAAAYSPASDAFLVASDDESDQVHIRRSARANMALVGAQQDITAGKGFGDLPGNLSPPTPMPDVAFDAVSGRWLVVFQAALKPEGSAVHDRGYRNGGDLRPLVRRRAHGLGAAAPVPRRGRRARR